jgi:hypothetical protein
MPLATDITGKLKPINCTITIPGVAQPLQPFVLPDMSESKSASYADEPVLGRAFPIKTFSHGDNRTIAMKWHVVVMDAASQNEAVRQLNAFRSAAYPLDGTGQAPYFPPPICTIACGIISTTGKDTSVCAVLKSYSFSLPTDVAWDEDLLLPYKFDIDLNWDVVYAADNLPGQAKIIG